MTICRYRSRTRDPIRFDYTLMDSACTSISLHFLAMHGLKLEVTTRGEYRHSTRPLSAGDPDTHAFVASAANVSGRYSDKLRRAALAATTSRGCRSGQRRSSPGTGLSWHNAATTPPWLSAPLVFAC